MITATARNDMDPCPRVELSYDWPGGSRAEVWRHVDGVASMVRGGKLSTVAPTGLLVDYEAPLGVDIQYEVSGWSGGGLAGTSGLPERVALSSLLPDDRLAIIQDPYAPASAMPVLLEGSAVSSLTRRRRVEHMEPMRGDRIGIGSRAGLPGEIPLSMLTTHDQDGDLLRSLLTNSYPLVVRSVNPIELPRVAYVSIDEFREVPIHRDRAGWVLWEMTATLVRPPAASIVLPVHTYREVLDIYPKYGDLLTSKATYRDVLRNPRLGA